MYSSTLFPRPSLEASYRLFPSPRVRESWQTAMPFIPILKTVLLVAQFQDTDGVLAINRHYFATASVPTETDLQDIAGLYNDWFTENYVMSMMDNWSLTGIVTRAMNEEFGLEFVATADLPQEGTVGTGLQPNQVSYTVTWLTGIVGRSFRGRTYGVGLPASQVASGQKRLTDAAQSAYQGKWEALRSGVEAAGHAMQVVSLQAGLVPRTEGVTTPVLATRVNFPLATQRRRLR